MPNKTELQRPNPRSPLALAATAFAGGIWLAGHLHREPALWGWSTAVLVLCAFAAVFKNNSQLAQLSAILALLCVGSFARVGTLPRRTVAVPLASLSGDRVEIVGHVIDDGALLAGDGRRERFDVQTETIQFSNLRFTQPVGIRATVFSRDAETEEDQDQAAPRLPRLAYGDRIRLTAKLRLPRNFRNPGAFDYEGYLSGLNISLLASVKAEDIEMLPGTSGSRLGFWRSRIRRSIVDHITSSRVALWSRDDAALFAAMIIGDDSLLLRNVREEFQQTGVYHLLVVSGMNVALLALAVFWLARRLRLPEWAASAVTIALSFSYAYVAGMGVPIVRAVLMLSVFLVARLLYRNRAALNATGFAALVVLVLSPSALFEAGFQLTFLALLAISGISLPILHRTSARYRRALQNFDSVTYDLSLSPRVAQFRLDLRLIAGRAAVFIGASPARFLVTGSARALLTLYELLVVSSVTQAVLVLPMRIYFHRATVIGLPANILVLPLAGIMLNSGVAAIALSYVSLSLARLAGAIAAAALHWTLRCIHALGHFHIAQWRVPGPGALLVVLAAAGVLLALVTVRRRSPAAWAGIVLLFASALAVAVCVPAAKVDPGKLEITAIDVGQGDSLLVVSPQGHTMLIDGGGSIGPVHSEFDFGEDVVSPYLWWRGLEHLDIVVLTHAHGDHIGGLPRVLQNFHPAELWVGMNPQTPALEQLYQAAAANHVAVHNHFAGEAFDWAGVRVRVLSPPSDWQPKAQPKNDDSLALLLSYGDTSALLAGDLEKKMERFVATESPHAGLLKIAHHGSATSTTPELLAAVQPSFAVISAGYRNSFGHPRPAVLERLQEAHVKTYRTDTMGVVTFLLDGTKIEPRVTLP